MKKTCLAKQGHIFIKITFYNIIIFGFGVWVLRFGPKPKPTKFRFWVLGLGLGMVKGMPAARQARRARLVIG